MKIAIIDCGTNRIPELSTIVGDFGAEFEVLDMKNIKACNCDEEMFDSFDGVIISGGPLILDESNKEEYIDKFSFIRKNSVPILGICLGHQIIGHVYGAKYFTQESIKINNRIHILNPDEALFSGIKNNSQFREDHEEHIFLPLDFILLADSNNCRNEAMKHNSKFIYGVQFHPEISGEVGEKLLGNFLEICK